MSSNKNPADERHGTGGQDARAPMLRANQLSLWDCVVSALGNIGPALGLFFVLALIVGAAGESSPLAVLIGMVAILVVGNSLVQFVRHAPAAGSFVTWVELGLGRPIARFTLVVVMLGYVVALSGVLIGAAGVTQLIIGNWVSTTGPWAAWTVLWGLVTLVLVLRGVKISARAVALLFCFEAAILLALSFAILVSLPHGRGLSGTPLTFGTNGVTGIASAFPLVVLLFVGWENAGALSEEAKRPRRNVGLSIVISLLVAGVIMAFTSYASVLGYSSLKALAQAPAPLDSLASKYLGGAHVILDFAILTSAASLLVAATNSQSRILYNAGRSRELPGFFGRISTRYGTPYFAISLFVITAFAMGAIWTALLHGNAFSFLSVAFTIAPLLLMIVYALVCAAVPVYYWRQHRSEFNWLWHALLPAVGIAALINPFYESVKPGPYPLNSVPWATLIGVVLALGFAALRTQLHRRGRRGRTTPSEAAALSTTTEP